MGHIPLTEQLLETVTGRNSTLPALIFEPCSPPQHRLISFWQNLKGVDDSGAVGCNRGVPFVKASDGAVKISNQVRIEEFVRLLYGVMGMLYCLFIGTASSKHSVKYIFMPPQPRPLRIMYI